MAVYVGLIRAIGPITHAVMKIGALREACERAGLADVSTVGNTGNVIFRSDGSVAEVLEIMNGAVGSFGLGPANEVFIRTVREMAAVVKANPFPEAAAERPAEVGVCSFHKVPEWKPVLEDYEGPEQLATVGSHLIVVYLQGITTSKLNVERRLGVTMTQRNWRVFAGLAEKAAALAKSAD